MSITKEATHLFTKVSAELTSWATIYAVAAAFLTGALVISAVGFAGPELLHNAAHDIRHSLAFPCH
jgi:cobalt transporter subunit CbtB